MNKKILGLLGIGCGLLLLTGCGSSGDKVVCTATESEGGMSMTAEVTAKLKDNKVDSAEAAIVFDSEETASQYYGMLALVESFSEDGKKLGAKLDGKKVTIENFANVIEEEADEEEGTEAVKVIGESKEDFIKLMEAEGYSCK